MGEREASPADGAEPAANLDLSLAMPEGQDSVFGSGRAEWADVKDE
jgi:hypothetical protein